MPLMRTGADPSGTRVLGTLNNCAGGVTPWGTILTGEENIQNYFRGKIDAAANPTAAKRFQRYGIAGRGRYMSWGLHDARFDLEKEPNESNRFGWIVEIDPYDPASMPIKHTGLGRFAHEGATVILAKDGRPVAYMGDDARFEYLYKFVATGRYDPANRAGATSLLDTGTLYAAKLNDDGTGEWLPLIYGQGPLTEANGFGSQAEVVINARGAGDLVGATKMDRPEDVEPNPITGKVYAALTSNDQRKPDQVNKANPRPANKFGHILEIIEDGGDHTGTRFRWEMLLLGGDPKNPDHGAYYQGQHRREPGGDAGQLRLRRPGAAVGGDRRHGRHARAERRGLHGGHRRPAAGPGAPVPVRAGGLRGLRAGVHAGQPDVLRGDPASRPAPTRPPTPRPAAAGRTSGRTCRPGPAWSRSTARTAGRSEGRAGAPLLQ